MNLIEMLEEKLIESGNCQACGKELMPVSGEKYDLETCGQCSTKVHKECMDQCRVCNMRLCDACSGADRLCRTCEHVKEEEELMKRLD